ncbi:DUF202 domain-containing protein [Streptomyces polyrhachis]|uniref:DUF202 domain-containing protein n=1 Tax=Streptomyces polyrhachis TaxID=1282885 RepID=A0ABW2GF09_9ACTN
MSVPSGGRDPGAQPERTRLAWRRTTLAAAVAALLGVRAAVHGSGPAAYAAAVVLVWLALLALAQRRIGALAAARPAVVALGTVWGTALCVVALALCGALALG